MKVKEESKKAGLKLYIQKTKFMASGPITSWQIEGGKVEAVRNFIFLYSKITVDGGCSHEIKRSLILRREAMTNLDSVLKSRDITLLTKICRVKTMFFSNSHVLLWKLNHKEGCMHAKSFQSCVTLYDLLDCSPPGSTVNGILWARLLERALMPSSKGSSQLRDQTCVSCLLHWLEGSLPLAPPGKPCLCWCYWILFLTFLLIPSYWIPLLFFFLSFNIP